MNYIIKVFYLFFVCLWCGPILGQDIKPQRSVSGSVKDINGLPIVGVSIYLKGKKIGTTTDFDGLYKLNYKSNTNDTLVASFLGFVKKEEIIGNRTIIDFLLEEDLTSLNEVVITGYQQIKSDRATGSYGILKKEVLVNQVTSNVIDKMEGAMAGVLVNEDNTFEIRGVSTLFGNDQPLIVVDGLPLESDLSDINPEDIEQITVLKDAASAAIYGVRSSNGVIVITTKKANANDDLKINFSSFFSFKNRHDLNDYQAATGNDIVDVELEYIQRFDPYSNEDIDNYYFGYTQVYDIINQKNNGLISQEAANVKINALISSDHKKQFDKYFLTNEAEQNYFLSVRGAGKKSNYYFSAGYVDNQSGFVGDKDSRLTINLKNDFNLTKWLDVGVNTYTTFTNRENNSVESEYMQRKPYELFVDENGDQIAQYKDWSMRGKEELVGLGYLNWDYNSIKNQRTLDKTVKGINLRMNAYLKLNILKELSFTTSFYAQFNRSDAVDFWSQESYYTKDLINRMTVIGDNGELERQIPQGGISYTTDLKTNAFTIRNQLDFSKNFGEFTVTALGGMEIREEDLTSTTQKRYGVDRQALQSVYINNPAEYFNTLVGFNGRPQLLDANAYFYDDNIAELGRDVSYYINAGTVYKNKYSISGSYRLDQSNLFGVDKRLRSNPLWSVGGLWNIAKEDFISNEIIKRLDFKVSYGITGNVRKGLLTNATAAFGTNQYQEIFLNKLSAQNDGLGHEDTKIFNIGSQFALFDWLSGGIEYFSKKGSNLLGQTPIDYTYGWLNAWSNYASTTNKGVELTFNFKVIENKDWNLNLGFNTTFVNSEVLDVQSIVDQASFYAPRFKPFPLEGYPVNSLFAFKYGGIDSSGTGLIINNEGEVLPASFASTFTVDDLFHVGSVSPTYFGGITSNLKYKNFTLDLLFTYKGGHVSRMPHPIYFDAYSVSTNTHKSIANRWRNPGDENIDGILPALRPSGVYYGAEDYGMFHTNDKVFDADHLRFRKVSLSYDMSSIFNSKNTTLSVYGEVRNIAVFTKNKLDIDPDFIDPYTGNLRLSNPTNFIIGIRATL